MASAITRDTAAATALSTLLPAMGPWTRAALWHGRGPLAEPPRTPLADELLAIRQQRLSGLLLRYVAESGAEVEPSHRALLRQTAFEWTAKGLRSGGIAVGVIDKLRTEGIEAVVSKGPGIARWYPHPQCRPYSDIDLLVAPREFSRSVDLLESDGWYEEARNLQPWDYFRRHCREGLNLTNDVGGSIDLHHRVPPWIWSDRLTTDLMATRCEEVTVGAATLPCLAAVDNLLVAALHVVSDRNAPGRSLIVWRDVVELANAAPPELAASAALRAGVAGWLSALLRALPSPMGTEGLARSLAAQPIPHPKRLLRLLSPEAEAMGIMASQLLRLPVPNGVAFAAGMTGPSRSFLAQKYPDTRWRYLRWWSNSRAHFWGPAAEG